MIFKRNKEGKVRSRGAQTTVEFAMILFPFLLILFACCDYAQLYFYENSLRHALREAGRFATPGGVLTKNLTNSAGVTTNTVPITSSYNTGDISRNESIRGWFQTNCVINISQANILISSWPGAAGTASETNANIGPGDAQDYCKISVTYPLQFITPVAAILYPKGVYNVTVVSIFQNEPTKNFATYTNRYTSEP